MAPVLALAVAAATLGAALAAAAADEGGLGEHLIELSLSDIARIV